MIEVSFIYMQLNFLAVRKLDNFKYLNFNKTLTTLYRKDIDKNTKPKCY